MYIPAIAVTLHLSLDFGLEGKVIGLGLGLEAKSLGLVFECRLFHSESSVS